jgi:hypothetical protein
MKLLIGASQTDVGQRLSEARSWDWKARNECEQQREKLFRCKQVESLVGPDVSGGCTTWRLRSDSPSRSSAQVPDAINRITIS